MAAVGVRSCCGCDRCCEDDMRRSSMSRSTVEWTRETTGTARSKSRNQNSTHISSQPCSFPSCDIMSLSIDSTIRLASGRAIPRLGYGVYKATGKECEDGVVEALRVGYRHGKSTVSAPLDPIHLSSTAKWYVSCLLKRLSGLGPSIQ